MSSLSLLPQLRRDGSAVADDLGQDVGLAQDQDFVGAELDLGAAVLRKDDFVALGDVHRNVLAVLVAGTGTDCEDLATLRLLLGRIGKDDATDGDFLLLEHLDDQAISKRLQIHSGASYD